MYFLPYTGITSLSAVETVQVSHALQEFASYAHCGAAGPVSKMASQQEKAFSVLRFKVSRSLITAQREFCAPFKKDTPHMNNVFLEPFTKYYIMKTYGEWMCKSMSS
jgi:hypothetical protein